MSPEEENENLARQHFGDDEDLGQEDEPNSEADHEDPEVEEGEGGEETQDNENSEGQNQQDEPTEEDLTDPEQEPIEEELAEEPAQENPNAVKRAEGESTKFYMARVMLQEYETAMARKKQQTEASMVRQQRNLHGALSNVFTLPSDEQRDAVNYVYRLFRENRTGAFSASMVNRGLRELYSKDRGKGLALRAMVNIILRTLDPANREETLQHLDLGPLLNEIDDEDVRAGIMEYLRIG